MPTPARNATAEIGAFGSAVKTSRAASRIRPSFRTAWDCRPGNRGRISSFISRSIHGTKHSVLLHWNGAIRSALARELGFRRERGTNRRAAVPAPVGDAPTWHACHSSAPTGGWWRGPEHCRDTKWNRGPFGLVQGGESGRFARRECGADHVAERRGHFAVPHRYPTDCH